jgi:hypothetical protein
MGGAHEALHHAEHAAHAGHGDAHGPVHGSTGKYIGITMALMGVMLAFSSALVGSARTELIKTMVEQQTAHSKYQAQATKYRLVVSQLQVLSATLPREADRSARDAALDKLLHEAKPAEAPAKDPPKAGEPAKTKEAAKDPAPAADPTALIAAIKLSTKQISDALAPHKEDVLKFTRLVHKYRSERDIAKEWTESFDAAIHAHTEAAEHYEWGQLCSEIGIVIASIALLFSSRKVWGVSLVLGLSCAGILGWTYSTTHAEVHHAEVRIHESGKKYSDLRKSQDEKPDDEKLVAEVEGLLGVPPSAHAPAAPAHAPEHAPAHH